MSLRATDYLQVHAGRPPCRWDAAESEEQKMPLTPTPPSPLRRRVLIVASEPATLRLCSDVLKNSGIAVDIAVAESGVAAVVAARKDVPDLIFVDIQLRDVPGREAIRWLRSNPALQSTPISMLATDTEADAVFARICSTVRLIDVIETGLRNCGTL
jgi:CheY-like chemotaxis protein